MGAGSSIPLGVSVTAVDADDVLSVTISGVPAIKTVTAAGLTPKKDANQNGTSMYTFTDLPPADLNAGFFVLHSSYSGTGLTAKQLTNRLTITVSNTTPGEDRDVGSYTTKTITVTDPPAGANGSSTLRSAGSQAGPESSSSSSLLWTNNAKLHDAMVASLHDALALTNNDTPLLYDSQRVI